MNNIDNLVEKKAKELIILRKKLFMIEWIEKFPGNVKKELREFGIPKSTYYDWMRRYRLEGKKGLERKKPVARSHPKSITKEAEEKILELRKSYLLGPARITCYLERYYGIITSQSTVTRTLVRNGVSRLPKTASRRTVHTKRYVNPPRVTMYRLMLSLLFLRIKAVKSSKDISLQPLMMPLGSERSKFIKNITRQALLTL